MRLFEAIVDANHRAVAGDAQAGLHPADYAASLPIIALTCIDPRLNAFFPNALALPGDQFIWLRNAGNIITGTMSSTLRSLALACAIKGGEEIAIIGHTDCQVCRTSTMDLLGRLNALGVDRSRLPENLTEFFGLFSSERQNVIKGADLVRQSPLIGPKIPVHGFLLDIQTGRLDWVVNGYDTLPKANVVTPAKSDFNAMGSLGTFADFKMGEMKFPDLQIGEGAARPPMTPSMTSAKAPPVVPSEDYRQSFTPVISPIGSPSVPPKIEAVKGQPSKFPLPPRLRPGSDFRLDR